MKTKRKIFWILIVLIFVAYLSTGITQIRPGERAVVKRFGRVLDDQPRPGLWIGLPWGMEEVEKIGVDQVRQVTVGYQPDFDDSEAVTPPGQFLTGDNNLVNIQLVVNYVVDPEHLVDYVREQKRSGPLIALVTEAALAEWVASYSIDEVLLRGSAMIPHAVLNLARARLHAYHLGVQLQSITVTRLQPPDQVKPAFDQVTRARSEMQIQVTEAEQDAARKESDAEAERSRLKRENSTESYKIIRLAQAEARTFEQRLAAYRQNPSILETGRWEHFSKLMEMLKQNGEVQPLDPALKPGRFFFENGKPSLIPD